MLGRRLGLKALGALFGLLLLLPAEGRTQGPVVDVANIDGEINSVTASYLSAVVSRAEADRAGALVIVINTPGGLGSAMDEIVTRLLNARVPVVAYVSPPGARAASAGLFVAQAADLVAMAPGTNIGSAHPVAGGGTDISGDLGQKVLNDAVARIRNLASIHGRNADWAESAVRSSVNVGTEEALKLHVADLEATSLSHLLAQIEGRSVPRVHGTPLTFHTAGAAVVELPMSPLQVLMHALINPDVAYLLMLVAIYGLIAEVSTPGAVLPGVLGVICALLALVAFASLPVNLAGVLLIVFGVVLFIIDLKAPTHGVLTAGGLIALVLGSAFLIDTGPYGLGVSPWLILLVAGFSAVFFGLLLRKVWQARRQRPQTGSEALLGSRGQVRRRLDPEGMVFVAGALWRAVTEAPPLEVGTAVKVDRREGLKLTVSPVAVEAAVPLAGPPREVSA
jgi:membrane-bound serine protease (ClpP class)